MVGKGKFQMEIFGYDFMINDQCDLFLIEANTNPCLEESSPLVGKLLHRMISISLHLTQDDAFRITIDRILHPFKSIESDSPLPYKFYDFLEEFELPGYNNWENLWEHLGSMH